MGRVDGKLCAAEAPDAELKTPVGLEERAAADDGQDSNEPTEGTNTHPSRQADKFTATTLLLLYLLVSR